MRIFDEMRRQLADFYTANPADTLSPEQLAEMARQAGVTVEAVIRDLRTPKVTLTCPLCGQPQTHLVTCKGCGGNAWGDEFQEVHGREAVNRLRRPLRLFLVRAEGAAQNQVHHALRRTYVSGGCLVCPACWRDTSLEWEAYLTCPLRLVYEKVLIGSYHSLVLLLGSEGQDHDETIRLWLDALWARWAAGAHQRGPGLSEPALVGPDGRTWVTIPEANEAVIEWRAALLHAALMDKPPEVCTQTGEEVGDDR